MTRLLFSNFSRLVKNKAVWLAALIMVAYGVMIYLVASSEMDASGPVKVTIDNILLSGYGFMGTIALPGIILAVICSLFVGTEYSDGTMRNKLMVGHTRIRIYFSNFISCSLVGLALNLIYMIIVFALAIPLFKDFKPQSDALGFMILDGILLLIAYSAIFNMLATLIQNKTTTAIICLLGVIAAMFTSIYILAALAEPEMAQVMQFIDSKQVTSFIPNTRYVSGTTRTIYQFIIDIFPSGQSIQLSAGIEVATHTWQRFICSIAIIAVTNIVGVFFFQKKDLK